MRIAIEEPFARDPETLKYLQRMDKLYKERLLGHPLVFGLTYCCFATPYECILFLEYSKVRRVSDTIEFKNRADVKGPFLIGCHNRVFYEVLTKERWWLYAGRSRWLRGYESCQGLEVLTSQMFLYLGIEFVDGREPNSATIRGNLYCVACAKHSVLVLMAFII